MGDEALPDDGSLAGDDLQNALGQARFEGELADADRGQGRDLGGFEDHGVPGCQGRGEAPPGDRHREVPGDDDTDNAERFGEGDVHSPVDGDLPTEEPLRHCRIVFEDIADVAGLPPGVPDRVSGVGDLEPGELFVGRVDLVGEAPQEPGAIGGGDGAPGFEGPRRLLYRPVRLFEVGEFDVGDRLFRRRVDDRVDAHFGALLVPLSVACRRAA